jgi:hypothetical protein
MKNIFGGKKNAAPTAPVQPATPANPAVAPGTDPTTKLQNEINAGIHANKPIMSVPDSPPPQVGDVLKRFGVIIIGVLVLSAIGTLLFMVMNKKTPLLAPEPEKKKPVLSSVKMTGDQELKALVYQQDYTVQVSASNYLIHVVSTPKRLIYNGKEVYRGEDLIRSTLSADGKHYAYEITRKEQRTKRDENTKILQDTIVDVGTYVIDGNKWGEKDNSRLVGLTNDASPNYIQSTGKQTPSQFGEPLNEEVIYNGEDKRFQTSYGVLRYEMSDDGKNWLTTTRNPSTRDVNDFYVNGAKQDSLDARILKRLTIDQDGNYLIALCQQPSDLPGVGMIGQDCQISVNGKTRTTISGSVYLAEKLGQKETYAGIDRELRQSFSKNARLDLILEHRKDMDEDAATVLGAYLNQSGDKYAMTTARYVTITKNDGTQEVIYRVYLSINSELIENQINAPSLLKFGTGDDDETLFIYELPKPDPLPETITPAPTT